MEKIRALALSSSSANRMMTGKSYSFNATCKFRKVPLSLSARSTNELDSHCKLIYETIANRRPAVFPRPMILADCCSFYGAILRLQPMTVDRCARIALSFLRDSLRMTSFSYVGDTANLGDVGENMRGSLESLSTS